MNNIAHWYQPIEKQPPCAEVTEDSLIEQKGAKV
jgi:hypothetical protein